MPTTRPHLSGPRRRAWEALERAEIVILAVARRRGVGRRRGRRGRDPSRGGSAEQVLVSVAAGLTTAFFESRLPAGSLPVIRVMPNTPALVGAGVSALPLAGSPPEHLAQVGRAVHQCRPGADRSGEPDRRGDGGVGFGTGLLFLFVEALVDAGVAAGLSRAVATDLAVQTMAGSAAMLLDRREADRDSAGGWPDTTAAELRALVTRPVAPPRPAFVNWSGRTRAAVAAAVEVAKNPFLNSSELHPSSFRALAD